MRPASDQDERLGAVGVGADDGLGQRLLLGGEDSPSPRRRSRGGCRRPSAPVRWPWPAWACRPAPRRRPSLLPCVSVDGGLGHPVPVRQAVEVSELEGRPVRVGGEHERDLAVAHHPHRHTGRALRHQPGPPPMRRDVASPHRRRGHGHRGHQAEEPRRIVLARADQHGARPVGEHVHLIAHRDVVVPGALDLPVHAVENHGQVLVAVLVLLDRGDGDAHQRRPGLEPGRVPRLHLVNRKPDEAGHHDRRHPADAEPSTQRRGCGPGPFEWHTDGGDHHVPARPGARVPHENEPEHHGRGQPGRPPQRLLARPGDADDGAGDRGRQRHTRREPHQHAGDVATVSPRPIAMYPPDNSGGRANSWAPRGSRTPMPMARARKVQAVLSQARWVRLRRRSRRRGGAPRQYGRTGPGSSRGGGVVLSRTRLSASAFEPGFGVAAT